MPLPRDNSPAAARTPAAAQPLRRRRVPPAPAGQRSRKVLHALLVFAIIVLTVDGFVGDKGLVETMRARREYRDVAAARDRLRQENARLQEQVRLLTSDAATIEGVAREELQMIRPGEILFIIRDGKPGR